MCNGDHLAALLLSQILYWSDRTSDPDGWFAKSYADWHDEVALTERQIKRSAHCSVQALEKAIYEFLDAHNEAPAPFLWTKSADEILEKVAGFCRDTLAAQGRN